MKKLLAITIAVAFAAPVMADTSVYGKAHVSINKVSGTTHISINTAPSKPQVSIKKASSKDGKQTSAANISVKNARLGLVHKF